jgi:threonine synthase
VSVAVESRGLEVFAADLPPVNEFVTLGEGGTPLLPLDTLACRLGLAGLSAKMETFNPTGSYKDRVAAMSLSLARQRGHRGWIATSSGNAGLAFAAYGARAALPGFLCLVASAPLEKRLPLIPYAIGIATVEGVGNASTGDAGAGLMERVRAAADRHGLFLGITANIFNPDGMRGIDTISYELAEQAPGLTHVYVPTGGGGLLVSIARGLRRRSLDARVVACQPAGCAPIARFLDGEIPAPVIARCKSDISALQLPNPPDGQLASDAAIDSGGWGTVADDEAILSAQRLLAAAEGIFVEPAAAAGLAALMRDVQRGRVGTGDHPVLILTGAGWKDLSRFAGDAAGLSGVTLGEVAGRIDAWAAAL